MNISPKLASLQLVVWLLWCLAIVSMSFFLERLKDAVPSEEEVRWRGLQLRDGVLDMLEPFHWYLRSRRLAKEHREEGGEIGRWSCWLFRSMLVAEAAGSFITLTIAVTLLGKP